MTGDAKHAVKEELEVDLDGPISALNRKPLNLKKEEVLIPKDERDNDNTPLALSKSLKKKPSISPKLNKQKPDKDDGEDEKPLKKKEVLKKKSMSNSVKKEVDSEKSRKRKRMEEKTKVKVKKESVSQEMSKSGKKEKKQYQLPGQKHESPEMRDPLRIFYETLYEKVPTSEMAATWMMERGLLSAEEAEEVYAKKLRKHHIQKFGSPGKVTPVKKSSTTSVKKKVKVTSKTMVKKTKKNLGNSEAGEDDFADEKTTPSKKSSAVSVKKQVKVTPKTTAKKSKKNLSDSETDEDDDDFVMTKKKSGNRKASG